MLVKSNSSLIPFVIHLCAYSHEAYISMEETDSKQINKYIMPRRDKYHEKMNMCMERVVGGAILDRVVGKTSFRSDIRTEIQM